MDGLCSLLLLQLHQGPNRGPLDDSARRFFLSPDLRPRLARLPDSKAGQDFLHDQFPRSSARGDEHDLVRLQVVRHFDQVSVDKVHPGLPCGARGLVVLGDGGEELPGVRFGILPRPCAPPVVPELLDESGQVVLVLAGDAAVHARVPHAVPAVVQHPPQCPAQGAH